MEKRNLAYGEDEIIVTCGATEALFAALSSILNPGDEVLVPTPAFGLYESIISVNRATFVPVDTRPTKFQLTLGQLETAATDRTKAIVLTSPNNPSGCVLNPRSLDAVAKFAKAMTRSSSATMCIQASFTKACTKATKACTLALRVAMANCAIALSCATAFRSRTP